MQKRIVFLNSLPLNMFQKYRQVRLFIMRVDVQQLRSIIESWKDSGVEIVSYIRHPSTVQVISQALGISLETSDGLYEYTPGDSIVVVTLKRSPRGREVQATLEDLDIFLVTVEFVQ